MHEITSNRRLLALVAVFALLAMPLAAGAQAATAVQTTSTPSATDGELTLEVSEQTDDTVNVTVSTTVDATAGYQADLVFDPDVVEVDAVAGGEGSFDPYTSIDNDAGEAHLNDAVAGQQSEDAPHLATITFTVVEPGTTDLEFLEEDSLVNDEDAEIVDVDFAGTSLSFEDDASDDGDDRVDDADDAAGDEEEEAAAPIPGFGVGVTVLALLAIAVSLRRRAAVGRR